MSDSSARQDASAADTIASKFSVTELGTIRAAAFSAGLNASDLEKILRLAKTVIEALQMIIAILAKKKV